MSLNEQIDEYFRLQGEIYDAVGYEEQWRMFPLDDLRDAHWMLIDDEQMVWSADPFTTASVEAGRNVYCGYIYTYRHLKKWIYRSKELTLAIVNTETDGNILMMVFDNSKECSDQAMKDLWQECW